MKQHQLEGQIGADPKPMDYEGLPVTGEERHGG